jgi:tetratricopeptide (TPR) repeat protein
MRERLPARTVRQPTDGTTIMTRSILITVVAGLLTAAMVSYVLTIPARQDRTPMPASSGNAVSRTADAAEAWPICSTMAVMVETPDWAALDPDFAAGKRAIAADDWQRAIRTLTSAALRDDRNADIQNYLGYAYRRLRQFDPAMQHYRRALTLNSRHRSAHEHLGEAHLSLGDLSKAKEQLAALEQICLIPCDEYDDLKRAIAEYNKVAKR